MDEQQLQQQIVQLVQAAMQGDQQAAQYIQQIMQAAQQGDQQAAQLAQMIQTVAQRMVPAAKFGARLNYIKQLKGQCPDGYEMQYFKSGGQLCKKCMKKQMEQGGIAPTNPVDAFKCGRKMKKKKCEIGGSVEMDKCGKKMKKAACGSKVEQDKCGNKIRKSLGGDNTQDYTETTEHLPKMRVPKTKRFGPNYSYDNRTVDKVRTPYGVMDRVIDSTLLDDGRTLYNDTIYRSNDPTVYFSLPPFDRLYNKPNDIIIEGGSRWRTKEGETYIPGRLRPKK